ncbi:hypothetical protein T01_8368 [Trichinella spiralis]|uniref:Uncharacterized protein n=1 Tax=Trichinella spiralis TaxID=6334 RepID=A0A0V1BIH4_TRISP|nr:hypothetical protein T01_8368 [Trichinella spiralis]
MNLRSQVSFPFLFFPLKLQHHATFLAISRQIRIYKTFWKVPRQTNASVSNKWSLKLLWAYLNTQGSCPSETPLKRIDDVVSGKSIFLHFRSISNKLKKIVSIRVEMCINSPTC